MNVTSLDGIELNPSCAETPEFKSLFSPKATELRNFSTSINISESPLIDLVKLRHRL